MNKNTINHQCKCPFCGEEYGHQCKTAAIDPGEGYRLLELGEMLQAGDELHYCGRHWEETEAPGLPHDNKHAIYRRKIDPPTAAAGQSTEPMFERRAKSSIGRVTSTFGQRGTEYGDTMADCQWLVLLATARKLGIPLDRKHARSLAIAGMVDIKYQRFQGGYKDDNAIDGVAYELFLADEMRELTGGAK